MSIGKKQINEILGVSFRAHHKDEKVSIEPYKKPIIHRQIHGDKVFTPLNKSLWNH